MLGALENSESPGDSGYCRCYKVEEVKGAICEMS